MSKAAVEGLTPEILWQRFYEISQVPRPSKKEEKIRKHLREVLNELNLEFKEDKVGNIVAKVPASKGMENAPIVVLQGHVDMVCEKNKDTTFDFDNDPIELIRDNGWIKANGTTLGSDNGIGVAAALAVVSDETAVHGPLELLFTVDEETGLTGANNLEPGFISGNYLLNMDSEEDGAFYIGCSGGIDTVGRPKIEYSNTPTDYKQFELIVTGLKGGHSGLDIIQGRGNAIKLLGRCLNRLLDVNVLVSKISGGSLRNAIPREAEVVVSIPSSLVKKAEEIISAFDLEVKNEFKTVDSAVKIIFESSKSKSEKSFTREITKKLINTIMSLPHGVIAMSADIPGLVETSTNLATVKMDGGDVIFGTSQRSSIDSAKVFISSSVASVFQLAGFDFNHTDGYPGWKPNIDSDVLKISKNVFKNLFNKEPEIKAIHAGLECGILEGKNPGMDMISFGPTIQNAHSPDERIEIETVERFYELVKGILKELAKKN
ncbi:MAG: aminoacyl-histidine dipeptidase [Ignavibacteriaceae bacterium]|nr:aminoacyl-histidine dipeptidase [Ignavibacteriaceae bacterium]